MRLVIGEGPLETVLFHDPVRVADIPFAVINSNVFEAHRCPPFQLFREEVCEPASACSEFQDPVSFTGNDILAERRNEFLREDFKSGVLCKFLVKFALLDTRISAVFMAIFRKGFAYPSHVFPRGKVARRHKESFQFESFRIECVHLFLSRFTISPGPIPIELSTVSKSVKFVKYPQASDFKSWKIRPNKV